MNVNVRELSQHVEFEPNTYYAAFSAELEASAYPMWALLLHLRTPDTVHLTRKVLAAAMNALQDWFDAINMIQLNIVSRGFQLREAFKYLAFSRGSVVDE